MEKLTLSTTDFSTLRGSNTGIRNGLRNEGYSTPGGPIAYPVDALQPLYDIFRYSTY